MKMTKPNQFKIKRYTCNDRTHLVDNICIFAANIEDAYQQCGIENYTVEQCFTHALEVMQHYEAYYGDITIGGLVWKEQYELDRDDKKRWELDKELLAATERKRKASGGHPKQEPPQ